MVSARGSRPAGRRGRRPSATGPAGASTGGRSVVATLVRVALVVSMGGALGSAAAVAISTTSPSVAGADPYWSSTLATSYPGDDASPALTSVNDVSCVNDTSCIAVGDYESNDSDAINAPLIEVLAGGSWSPQTVPASSYPNGIESSLPLSSVSCPPDATSTDQCVAVGVDPSGADYGAYTVYDVAGSWRMTRAVDPDPPSVPCGPDGCSSEPANLDNTIDITSVSCGSVNFCVAAGTSTWTWETYNPDPEANGFSETGLTETWNGASWTAADVAELVPPGGGNQYPVDVSCLTVQLCVAQATYGTFVEDNGGTWSLDGQGPVHQGSYNTFGDQLRCTTASLCSQVGPGGLVVDYLNGGLWFNTLHAWPSAPAGDSLYAGEGFVSASCTDADDCVAVGGLGLPNDEIVPMSVTLSGGSFEPIEVLPQFDNRPVAPYDADPLRAVWCDSSLDCQAVGDAAYSGFYSEADDVAASVPDAPIIGTATAVDGDTACATVPWTVTGDGGSPVTSFDVETSGGGQMATGPAIAAGAPGSPTDPTPGAQDSTEVCGLVRSVSYEFAVSATNSVGMGDYSGWSATYTPPVGATITLTGSPVPATPGPVDYAVTVTGGGPTPTGSVTVSDDAGASCSIDPLVSGTGSCQLTEGSPNVYTVTASYSGDSNYAAGSTSLQVVTDVSNGTAAGAGNGMATATALGGTGDRDTVTYADYPTDPESGLTDGTAYFDVSLSPGNTFSSVTITDTADVTPTTALSWWDPTGGPGGTGGWEPVEGDPGPNYSATPSPTLTVTLDGTTSPTLAQLTGTVFGAGNPPPPAGLTITTSALPGGERLTPYSTTLTAAGGTNTDKWSIASGTLPVGLRLSSAGLIAGTPSQDGTSDFTVAVANAKTATQPAQRTTAALSITITQPAPAVTRVATASGSWVGGTRVVITGTALESASAVLFGTVPAASFTASPHGTSITAYSPSEGAGTVDITVTTPGGTSPPGPADQFTFLPPSVTKVSPGSGPAAGGTTVTIVGKGFQQATAVMFGETEARTYTVNGAGTSIAAVAPTESPGVVDVTVTAPGGTSATGAADTFSFLSPAITRISPPGGLSGGGTPVTISGTDLEGATSVRFGTVPATAFLVNGAGTSITALAPAGSPGVAQVTVTNPGGTASANFTYSPSGPAPQGYVQSLFSSLLFETSPSSAAIGPFVQQLQAATTAADQQVAAAITSSGAYDQVLVSGWYQQFLGRSPSGSETAYWTGLLQGGATDEEVVDQIVASPEYYAASGGTPTGFVTAALNALVHEAPSATVRFFVAQLGAGATDLQVVQGITSGAEYDSVLVHGWYQRFLGQSPNTSTTAYWTGLLQGGATDEEVVDQIVGSPVFATASGGSPTAFVTAALTDLLGQPSSPGAVATFVTQIESAIATADLQVASMFTASAPYDSSLVTIWYERYLGRTPSSSDTAYWTGLLQGGATDEEVVDQIVGSPEFYDDAGGTPTAFVTAALTDLLGQAPSTATVEYFVGLLPDTTDAGVVQAITSTGQYEQALASGWCQQYLGRTLGGTELAYFQSELAGGATDEQVVDQIVSSAEYLANAVS